MDWPLALKLNQDALLRTVAWLFTSLKLEVGESVETMPRLKRLTVLFVLRPSESAYRRLILVAMFVHGIEVPLIEERAARLGRAQRKSHGEKATRNAALPFKLVDPRKNFDLHPNKPKYRQGPGPRITDLWSDDPIYDRSDLYAWQNRCQPTPEDEVSAVTLCHRMNALMAALGDLCRRGIDNGKSMRWMKCLPNVIGSRARHSTNSGRPIRLNRAQIWYPLPSFGNAGSRLR